VGAVNVFVSDYYFGFGGDGLHQFERAAAVQVISTDEFGEDLTPAEIRFVSKEVRMAKGNQCRVMRGED